MQTVRGMVENYLHATQIIGYVPHGNRVYYTRRSQNPVLPRLVSFYVSATNDNTFGIKAVKMLEQEFLTWDVSNTVIVNGHKLYVYGDITRGPRPEAYKEDYLFAAGIPAELENERQQLYAQLRTATETAFTYSSRWFIKDGTNDGSRIDTKCRNIIATELNSIFYRNLRQIAGFFRNAGNNVKAAEYDQRATDLLAAITAVLWNEEDGIWYDYDLINNKPRKYYSVSNFIPLASFAYDFNNNATIASKVMQYISNNNLDSYMGGIPTTLVDSGEDWDFPNVLPQMQWVVIAGLKGLNQASTNAMAEKFALRLLETMYIAYQNDGVMYDKVRIKMLITLKI